MINIKVIFLVIDGVLNTSETFKRRKEEFDKTGVLGYRIDEFRVEYLKEIVDSTNAKIVLISVWRKDFDKINNNLICNGKDAIEIVEVLSKYGLEIYDIINPKKHFKQDGIKEWLDSHDVNRFVIFDDESFDLMYYYDFLIKTRNSNREQVGLLQEHVLLAKSMLNNKKLVLKNKHDNKH